MSFRKKKWNVEQLKNAVLTSRSIRQVIEKLGLIPAGGNYDQIKKYIKLNELNITHFVGKIWNKGLRGIGKPMIPLEKVLISDSSYQSHKLKQRLFSSRIKEPKCEECGWAKNSLDGRLPLELDHINGNRKDNRLENLRILCPNCHSLQSTHRGRNSHKIARVL